MYPLILRMLIFRSLYCIHFLRYVLDPPFSTIINPLLTSEMEISGFGQHVIRLIRFMSHGYVGRRYSLLWHPYPLCTNIAIYTQGPLYIFVSTM
ncbi:hypothetical protein Hanom_Chr05g00445361 [Helianthus anomalus]